MINLFALGCAVAGGAITGMAKYKWDNKDIDKLKETWSKTLLRCHAQGIRLKTENGQWYTFTLMNVKRTENGYRASSLVPVGLDFEALVGAKSILESNLNARVEIEKDTYCKWININIISNRPRIDFKKIECDCNMFFGGYKLNGKPNLIDLDCDSHIVILGRTRTGKSVAMFMGLTNLFANAKKYNNFKVYFLQTKKRDLCMFENCKNVQKVGKTLNECEKILKGIMKELEIRADLVEKYSCKDINEYNKLNPQNKISRLIIVGEEFSFFKEDDADTKEDKELKQSCEQMILEIVKTGGGYNVNLISALQRPTVDNLNTTVRSQLSVITFKLKSENDSKIAVQQTGAEKLNVKEREAIFDGNLGTENIIYPKLSQDFKELREVVPSIKKPIVGDVKEVSTKKDDNSLSYEETQLLKARAKKEHMHILDSYRALLKDKDNTTPTSPEPKTEVKYQGKYNDEILEFIEKFGVITVSQVKSLFSKNNADRILSDVTNHNNIPLNQNDIIKNNGKVYYKPDSTPTMHKVLIADYYAKLASTKDIEIVSYSTSCILKDNDFKTKSKIRKPDLEILYKYKDKLYKTYLEVDDTHETDEEKLDDYLISFNKADVKFDVVILKKDIKKEQIFYKDKMKYRLSKCKNFTVMPS